MHSPSSAPQTAPLTPQLSFAQVRHERLRPARNAFRYGVYQLRLPLRACAQGVPGNAVFSHNRFNLLSFHDADHGDGQTPPMEWISRLLKDEGVNDVDGEILLQTFPRVLGFVFNPVSFWFCHRADGGLRAILCEVNNTFGERHCYLLAHDDGRCLVPGEDLRARKVFHVSPFCSVSGDYRFRFLQVQRRERDGRQTHHVARIEHHDEAGPLLLTSISGTDVPLTAASALRAFFGMPLMTLMVVFRINWQALRLLAKRVPFHRKPSAPALPVSR